MRNKRLRITNLSSLTSQTSLSNYTRLLPQQNQVRNKVNALYSSFTSHRFHNLRSLTHQLPLSNSRFFGVPPCAMVLTLVAPDGKLLLVIHRPPVSNADMITSTERAWFQFICHLCCTPIKKCAASSPSAYL